MFQRCFKDVLRVFRNDISKMVQGCLKDISRMIRGCFMDVLKMFWGCFRDVLALFYYIFTRLLTHFQRHFFEIAQNASLFKISTSARIASIRAVQKLHPQPLKPSILIKI